MCHQDYTNQHEHRCDTTRGKASIFNPLNAELNPKCHLLALLGGTTIVVVSRLRVKEV